VTVVIEVIIGEPTGNTVSLRYGVFIGTKKSNVKDLKGPQVQGSSRVKGCQRPGAARGAVCLRKGCRSGRVFQSTKETRSIQEGSSNTLRKAFISKGEPMKTVDVQKRGKKNRKASTGLGREKTAQPESEATLNRQGGAKNDNGDPIRNPGGSSKE